MKPPLEKVLPTFTFSPAYCGPIDYEFIDLNTSLPGPSFLYFNSTTRTASVFSTDSSMVGTYTVKINAVLRTNGFGQFKSITWKIIIKMPAVIIINTPPYFESDPDSVITIECNT